MNVAGFCNNTHQVLSLIGWVLVVFKIAIPLIIIVVGLIDLGKAAVSSKPEEIKKSVGSLLWRLVGGVAIFFVPVIIMTIFGWVSGYTSAKSTIPDWNVCYDCIVAPYSSTCTNAHGQYDNL